MNNSMCNTNNNRCNENNSGCGCAFICPPGPVGPKGATGPAGATGATGGILPLNFANITTSSSQYCINTPIPLNLTTDPTAHILVSGSNLVLSNPGSYLINANATFTSTPPPNNYQPVVFRIINAQTGQIVAQSTNAIITDVLFGPVSAGTIVTAITDPITLNFVVVSTSGEIIDFSIQVVKIG